MRVLYLIPNAIQSNVSYGLSAPPHLERLRLFFVEEPKSARRLLRQLAPDFPLQECRFVDLNEHTTAEELRHSVQLLKTQDAGLISECGAPCVADPGSGLVFLAHEQGIEVMPWPGPSALVMGLMASGLNGQNFAFNGYLPKNGAERSAKIKALQERLQQGQTQIVMEVPYRNQHLFKDLLKNLDLKVHLCVACDMMGGEHWIKTKTVAAWQKTPVTVPLKPALFIFGPR